MVDSKYNDIIISLTTLTQRDVLKWQKDDLSQLGFFCFSSDMQKFLVDKFYSIIEGKQVTCLNLTIFKASNSDKIVDEINLCPTMAGEELDNFKLLNILYKQVESQYDKYLNTTKGPILTNITESLQRQLQSN